MSTKFFTNKQGNSLISKFEGILTNIPNLHTFDTLVGYFRSSGYFKLRKFLDNIPKIRILVGINVDVLTKKYHDKGIQFMPNAQDTKESFLAEMAQDIQKASYTQETEKGILQFLEDLSSGKIEMRAHPTQKIHAKVYIFKPQNFNESSTGQVITGSSNLTDAGMGTYQNSNYEFNVSLRDYEDILFASQEFEQLWAESVPILKTEAKELENRTYLKKVTPFELYIKTLIEYFGKRVEYDPYNIDILLPDTYKRLKYQSDSANQGYAMMMRHNGFILADVVGLGKTIIASMIIKKFIYENGTNTKVLIVLPPALEISWKKTIADFQLQNHCHYLSLGSLDNIFDEKARIKTGFYTPDKYDLVVVDESHKFRNDYTEMYSKLQEICKTPRSKPAENGDTHKKIILMSATPMNNAPKDIENQLYLFQDKRNSTLERVRNIQEYFEPINRKYKKYSKELKEQDLSPKRRKIILDDLRKTFKQLREDIIEQLVIRRTRKDIENNEDYLEDLKEQNIEFPHVSDPTPIYYELDKKLGILFNETINVITNEENVGGLGYYRYRAIEYLATQEHRSIYGNVESISEKLASIMRTMLVKRLESSFYAFKGSLKRLANAINNMLEMFANDEIFIAPDLDINKMLEIEEQNFEKYETQEISWEQKTKKIKDKIKQKGGNNAVFSAKDFNIEFQKKLENDLEKVNNLIKKWGNIKNDPKLEVFLENIKNVFFDEQRNSHQKHDKKLVIFSESIDTTLELERELTKNFSNYKVLKINSKNRDEKSEEIAENFDANFPIEKQKNDFQIIITTEVLAEGINLHRSNVILNYDVPWNATRLMQRIGRVNRIGTTAKEVFVYNFYPSSQGDDQIKLVNNALRKLQAFHTAFGEDNKIFSILEEKEESALFGHKIQREESEILLYLNELRDFRKKNPKRYEEIAKISDKSRCARSAKGKNFVAYTDATQETILTLENTSIAYLKSENHQGIFCMVFSNLKAQEISFLQAIKILKAQPTDEALALPDIHHTQAQKALDFFKTENVQQEIKTINATHLSPAENQAITNMKAIQKLAKTPQQKTTILQVIETLKNGALKKLPKQINDFVNANKNNATKNIDVFLKDLFEQVLDNYNFNQKNNDEKITLINAKIVLAQTFLT